MYTNKYKIIGCLHFTPLHNRYCIFRLLRILYKCVKITWHLFRVLYTDSFRNQQVFETFTALLNLMS